MKPSETSKAMVVGYEARQPLFIEGPPGIGKSSITAQVTDALGIEVKDVRAVLMDAVDLGLPYTADNGTDRKSMKWAVPEWLPQDGEGIILLDELKQAAPMVQNALSELILDRRIRDYYTLPDGWSIVAISNRDEDKAATHRTPSHMMNRFTWLEMEHDNDDWHNWALDNNIRMEVIMFIKWRPEALFQFDPKSKSKAYPTPRSWEFVSNLLNQNPPKEILLNLITGTVGTKYGTEFYGFLEIFNKLPNPDLVLMDAANFEIPEEPQVLFALCGALAKKANLNTVDRVVTYANRLDAEYSVLLMEMARRENEEITSSRSYVQWVTAHQDSIV